ncbi:hypothetical protein BKI52_15120 [marine bacterium AO1-C]|nr:hypothetical protein BKI52_15120 [marine bacterium AO1-C]
MKTLITLLSLSGLFVLLSFVTPDVYQEKWRKYKFKQGNFKVKLPAKPTIKERRDKFVIEAESEGIIYQIEFNKTKQNNDLKLAKHLVTKELTKIKREVSLQEEIRVENTMGTQMLNLPIQEIRLRNARNQLYQYRVLITKHHTYRFIIIKYNKTLDQAKANALFGSFKLLKKEK